MNLKKTLVIATVGLLLASATYANECRRFDRKITKLEREKSNVSHRLTRAELKFYSAQSEFTSRRDELNRAINSVANCNSAISTLEYEYDNADSIIAGNNGSIAVAQAELKVLNAQERKLWKKYDDTSSNFFQKLKKWNRRRVWKNKQEEIKSKQNEIAEYKSNIDHINYVGSNFDALMDDKESDLTSAEYHLDYVESKTPTVASLRSRKDRLYSRFSNLKSEKYSLNSKLRRVQDKRDACYTSSNNTPETPQGPGGNGREGRRGRNR